MAKVRVPATSANVGCGFDTLGVALSVYNTFTFEVIPASYELIGCEPAYNNEENLVYQSFLYTLNYLQKEVSGVRIHFDCQVPMSGGLGSSSTCVVGGIYGAYALSQTPIDEQEILRLATKIEGHPDNVSPAIFGGLSASCMVDNEAISVHYDIDRRFQFLALIPDFETLTHQARKVLPKQISYQDAIFNLSRLGVVLKAFEKYDLDVLGKVMEDRLHEPYRKVLIHEYDAVRSICESIDSVAFLISGSGSTLMNIVEHTESVPQIQAKLESLTHHWKALLLKVDKKGTVIL